jgi:hypothetical protein
MSGSVDLVCVDPKQVQNVWPAVKHLIERAILRTGLNLTADVEYDTLRGDSLLWLAWDAEARAIRAAATTVLARTDTELVCILTACGGERMREWLPLLAKIEAYARAEGCGGFRIYGRKGWARVLDGYRVEHVILRKDL